MKRIHYLVATLSLCASTLVGCSDSDSPTAPRVIPTGLTVDSFSTATQIEPGGFRIQVRMRVVEGLASLDRAVQQGSASAQTCMESGCVGGSLTSTFGEASCPAGLRLGSAGTELGFGLAWLEGDVVGVDFCVSELAEGMTFETTLSDGLNRSNVVRTSCVEGFAGLTCGSG